MRKKILIAGLAFVIVVMIWNYPMTYRVGVNGEQFEKKIPLYAKTCGFLYRDWAYRDLVRGIIGSEKDQARIVLAILNWTHDNIMRGVPKGLKTVDDHPLNIIIRQYAAEDQVEDIFTILCSYAGMQADWGKCCNADKTSCILLSFVKVNGRRLLFDASKNKYFMNTRGDIASTEDCVLGDIVLSGQDREDYMKYLSNIRSALRTGLTRADEQMPLRRIPLAIRKIFEAHE